MSYSIIRETKICRLADGRIIHFSLDGCNNDDAGRDRHDFRGKIYSAEEWEKEISRWENSEGNNWSLKIGSKYSTWHDYGKHLRTMTKRAMSMGELLADRHLYGRVYDGITYFPESGEPVNYPPGKEETDIVYGIWYGKVKGFYRGRHHIVDTEEDIVNALEKKLPVNFYIGKAPKKKVA